MLVPLFKESGNSVVSEFLEFDNRGMLSLVSVPHGAVTCGVRAGIMTGGTVAWPRAATVVYSHPRNSEFSPPSVLLSFVVAVVLACFCYCCYCC